MGRLVGLTLVLLTLQSFLAYCQRQVTQIFAFEDSTFIENLTVLPDGTLLLTTLSSARLLTLDPSISRPIPRLVADIPDATGLTGIAHLGSGLYAISGGRHTEFRFDRGSMNIYIVSLDAGSGAVMDVIPVPNTFMMNGLASVPSQPHILLSADSIEGRILRINTITRQVDVAIADEALAPRDSRTFPLGVNGLRIRNDYLYFTNSGRGTFARIRITTDGSRAGPTETLAVLSSPANGSYAYDDFTFDSIGNAYLTLHPSAVNEVTTGGLQYTFAGGGSDRTIKQPTSAALANDGQSIYVSTGGTNLTNQIFGGQILKINLT
ncbi:hypothetical protein HIM_05423 [Hirsutella minnesotensis 3608]|uniref:SMP-30/Gluconolactonase/LRE-like region domain-containing protein n=1 Tax=Hirsutella minnesotensis 3608 TaxID=1043627 RepID=A0A0F8A5F3_9HYPO|nr:hypothetical protein HIM_05423 [Hirsutella minnesotensis 3608]